MQEQNELAEIVRILPPVSTHSTTSSGLLPFTEDVASYPTKKTELDNVETAEDESDSLTATQDSLSRIRNRSEDHGESDYVETMKSPHSPFDTQPDKLFGIKADDQRLSRLASSEFTESDICYEQKVNEGKDQIDTTNDFGSEVLALHSIKQEFLNYVKDLHGESRVLIVGSGHGALDYEVLNLNKSIEVISNDINPTGLEYHLRKMTDEMRKRSYLSTNKFPTDINLGENTLDAVAIFFVDHYQTPQELDYAYKSTLFPALRPGGKIFSISLSQYVFNFIIYLPFFAQESKKGIAWPYFIKDRHACMQRLGEEYNNIFYKEALDYSSYSYSWLPATVHPQSPFLMHKKLSEFGYQIEKCGFLNPFPKKESNRYYFDGFLDVTDAAIAEKLDAYQEFIINTITVEASKEHEIIPDEIMSKYISNLEQNGPIRKSVRMTLRLRLVKLSNYLRLFPKHNSDMLSGAGFIAQKPGALLQKNKIFHIKPIYEVVKNERFQMVPLLRRDNP